MGQNIPEWLVKEENYSPPKDRDSFIDKSIMSLLTVLSKIRLQSAGISGQHSVNPFLKVFFTLLIILLAQVSRNFSFIISVIVYHLVQLSLMSGETIIRILKICFFAVLFTSAIMLPAVLLGINNGVPLIVLKVFISVMAVNILSYTTSWNSLTEALKKLYVPDIFILVLDITIKFMVNLGELVLNMLYALKLRSVGKNSSKYDSLSGISGTMFLKSREMAQDMFHAMELRGYTGEYHSGRGNNTRLTVFDFVYFIANLVVICIFFY